MTPHMKWGIGGVIVGLILLGFIPFWLEACSSSSHRYPRRGLADAR